MKKIISTFVLWMFVLLAINAQQRPFVVNGFNKEYNLSLVLNLYKEDIIIPGQEILGKVYGYLKKNTDSRVWIIMESEISADGNEAMVEIINDYGSEELQASIIINKNGEYVLKQLEGSPIKIAGNGKWIKLPKTLIFKAIQKVK